ncbi:flagellar operon protein [Anaerobacterium chartisolvens]|uniref:Flagellar operon protein n=1 Tax=Anaerobacterium chartisolvens TaxID=1297424 RepID=A0A369B4K6_9FIRM|nr:TIGR02530 family flagellar biosynthesis protein [Anaerobacterium chartisolvens]RCX15518.1 flagellar operon protein [Anaerobacterium chartisolvens]
MVVNNKFLNGINGIPNGAPIASTVKSPGPAHGEFDKILKEKVNETSGLKFSKHAELRLQARNINISGALKDKLSGAVDKAQAKGVRDSLVIADNVAFVINVKSRTVITAISSDEMKQNVFTNIDGAVFA